MRSRENQVTNYHSGGGGGREGKEDGGVKVGGGRGTRDIIKGRGGGDREPRVGGRGTGV